MLPLAAFVFLCGFFVVVEEGFVGFFAEMVCCAWCFVVSKRWKVWQAWLADGAILAGIAKIGPQLC